MPTEDEFRELDLQIGDLNRENSILRHKLDRALDEAVRLRHKLEHIYALSHLALRASEPEGASEGPPPVGEAATEIGAE